MNLLRSKLQEALDKLNEIEAAQNSYDHYINQSVDMDMEEKDVNAHLENAAKYSQEAAKLVSEYTDIMVNVHQLSPAYNTQF